MPLPNLLANKPFNYTTTARAAAQSTKDDHLDYESSSAFRDHIKQKIHTSSSRRSTNQSTSYSRNNELVNLDQRNSSSRPIDLKLGPDFMFTSKSTYSRPSSRSSLRNQSQNSVENFRNGDDAGGLYTPRKSSVSGVVTRRQRIFYDKNENSNDNNINNDEITTSTIINDDEDEDRDEYDRSRKNRDNRSLDQLRNKNVSRTSRNSDYEPSMRTKDYFESQTPRLKSGRLTSRHQDREDSFFKEPPIDRDANRSNSRAGNRRLASLEGGSYLNNSNLMNGYTGNKENKTKNNTPYSTRSTSPIKARRRLDDPDDEDDDDDVKDVDQLPTLSARDTFREPSSRLRTTLVERSTNSYDARAPEVDTPRRLNSSRLKDRSVLDFNTTKPQETRNRTERNVFDRRDENESRLADSSVRKPVPLPRKHLTATNGWSEDNRRDSNDLFSKNEPSDFGAGQDFRNEQQPIIRGNTGRRYQPTLSAKSNRLLNLRQKNYDSNFN